VSMQSCRRCVQPAVAPTASCALRSLAEPDAWKTLDSSQLATYKVPRASMLLVGR
jgi:hypothetical protein